MIRLSQKISRYFAGFILGFLMVCICYSIVYRINNPVEFHARQYLAIRHTIENLMPPLVQGLPAPNRQESQTKMNGYTFLIYQYNSPSPQIIETIEKNIQSQKNWQEIVPRIQDNNAIFKSYCNGEIALNLSNNTIPFNAWDDKSYQRLDMNMYWSEKSDCMAKKP